MHTNVKNENQQHGQAQRSVLKMYDLWPRGIDNVRDRSVNAILPIQRLTGCRIV